MKKRYSKGYEDKRKSRGEVEKRKNRLDVGFGRLNDPPHKTANL